MEKIVLKNHKDRIKAIVNALNDVSTLKDAKLNYEEIEESKVRITGNFMMTSSLYSILDWIPDYYVIMEYRDIIIKID